MHNLTEARWGELLDRQRILEETGYAEGAARFKRRLLAAEQGGKAATVGGAKRLMRDGLARVEEAIQEICEGKRLGGPRHTAVKWCKLLGYDVAAYMTLKVVLDGVSHKNELRKVAMSLVALMCEELQYREFKKQAPGLFRYKLASFHTSSYTHMARSLNASIRIANIEVAGLSIPMNQRMVIGVKLISILIEATGLVEKQKKNTYGQRKPKTHIYLAPTEETTEWLREHNGALALMQALVSPMVVPPLKWSPGVRGGYRFALRGRYSMVRRVHNKAHQAKLDNANLPLVYETLNCVQNTAWRINTRVFKIINQIIAQGGGVAGLPEMNLLPLPAKPQDIETNEPARKKWSKAAGIIKEENIIRRQKVLEVTQMLSTANSVASEVAVFFPHSLDFRGRIYAISAYLSPQGNDLSRGLLTFAQGKPMDAVAVGWLAVHGANCLGKTPEGSKVSKMTLAERHEWIIKNSGRILMVAKQPLQDLWWAEAEKPLQFLAFCLEWAGLLAANDRDEDYICSLPCNMDGSCNGLQHFSALFQDEAGGAAVNVTPQHEPQDIYSKIATVVLDKLMASIDPVAALWLGLHHKLGLVDRKLTKRPTMTFGYGSKRFGFREQVYQYLRALPEYKMIQSHFSKDEKRLVGAACILMSNLIWEALEETVVAAFAGMDWMQRASRGITKQNKAVEWTVPMTGFPVRQEYYRLERKQVKTLLAGQVIRPSIYSETSRVDGLKQRNGISPNFIHSLDAAALMLTVVNSAAEGVEQFSMIHDSYGTLPSDYDVLARCCRQAFCKLYMQQDVADLLYRELRSQWPTPWESHVKGVEHEECPPPPTKGTLDVSQVLASTYFFA